MGTAVAITWKKCRDGAELLNYGGDWTGLEKELMSEGELLMAIMGAPPPPHGEATKRETGRWIRLRSSRFDPIPLRMVDLSNPVVLDFIAAQGFDGVVSFVEKYGLPDYGESQDDGDRAEIDLEAILRMRKILVQTLSDWMSGRTQTALKLFEVFAEHMGTLTPELIMWGDRLVLSLRPTTLYGYMTLELASIMAGGVSVLRCEHCQMLFAAGEGTGRKRRQSVAYCSNKCRVAHQRLVTKEREAQLVVRETRKARKSGSDVTDLRPVTKKPLRKADVQSA